MSSHGLYVEKSNLGHNHVASWVVRHNSVSIRFFNDEKEARTHMVQLIFALSSRKMVGDSLICFIRDLSYEIYFGKGFEITPKDAYV